MLSFVTLKNEHLYRLDPQLDPGADGRRVTSHDAPTVHSNDGPDGLCSDL
jgi:hypothetical protein